MINVWPSLTKQEALHSLQLIQQSGTSSQVLRYKQSFKIFILGPNQDFCDCNLLQETIRRTYAISMHMSTW